MTRYSNMNLPTSLNLHADYHVSKNLYLGYTSSTALEEEFRSSQSPFEINTFNCFLDSSEKIGIALPLSIQRNGQFNVGLSGRINLLELTNKLNAQDGMISVWRDAQYYRTIGEKSAIQLQHICRYCFQSWL